MSVKDGDTTERPHDHVASTPDQGPPPASPSWSMLPSQSSASGDQHHYGRIGKVPWTFAQTLLGASVTLVPWMLFIVLTQLTTPKTAPQHPIPFAQDLIAAILTIIMSVIVEGAFLLAPAYYAVMRRARGLTPRDGLRALGFRSTPLLPALSTVVVSLVTVVAASALYETIVSALRLPLETNGQVLAAQAPYAPLTTIALLISAVVIAPFCEEIFFRGFLFSGLLRGMSVWSAVLASALVFGIAHGDIGSFVPLLIIGLVLALVRWRTGSIWPGMLIHMLNNALAAVYIISLLVH